jgi:hypothetical protein
VHACEAEGQDPAGQVALELAGHEARQAVTGYRQEGRQVLAQNAVQNPALGLAADAAPLSFLGGHAAGTTGRVASR